MKCVARLLACLVLVAVFALRSDGARGQEPSGLAAVAAIESALVEAIAKAEKSVVAIARVSSRDSEPDFRPTPFGELRLDRRAEPDDPDFIPNAYATGVVVGNEGQILTAYHVLQEGSDYWITTPERRRFRARVIAADPRGDLAVLAPERRYRGQIGNLKPITLGDASKLRKGQIVIALGNPYSLARDGQSSASWGIVANLARKDAPLPEIDREARTDRPALHQYGSLIQTDAKLNLGTSGGALINLSGEMVGLTVALSATLGYEQSAGFAIPVDDAFKRTLERLKEGREAEYGFLGVRVNPLSRDERARGIAGVTVIEVVQGTPAHQAGLHSMDLLTHVGQRRVFDVDEFMLEVGRLPAAARVRLAWNREGRAMSRTVDLAKYPVLGRQVVTTPEPAWRGMRVDYVTTDPNFSQLTMQGRIDSRGSILITEVEEQSPAWNAGLRPEMVISHAAGRLVRNPNEFREMVAGADGPVELRLVHPTEPGRRISVPAE